MLNESQIEEAEKNFCAYLKKKGLKFTGERKKILHAVLNRTDHFEADELSYDLAKDDTTKVSRATVYRTLELLYEMKFVNKTSFGHRHQHYENMVGRENHSHLICLDSDVVIEFNDEIIHQRILEICKQHNFKFEYDNLQIFGYDNTNNKSS